MIWFTLTETYLIVNKTASPSAGARDTDLTFQARVIERRRTLDHAEEPVIQARAGHKSNEVGSSDAQTSNVDILVV